MTVHARSLLTKRLLPSPFLNLGLGCGCGLQIHRMRTEIARIDAELKKVKRENRKFRRQAYWRKVCESRARKKVTTMKLETTLHAMPKRIISSENEDGGYEKGKHSQARLSWRLHASYCWTEINMIGRDR